MSLYPSSIEGTEYWIVVAGEYELIDTLCHLLRDFSVGFGGNVREPMIAEVYANVGSLITEPSRESASEGKIVVKARERVRRERTKRRTSGRSRCWPTADGRTRSGPDDQLIATRATMVTNVSGVQPTGRVARAHSTFRGRPARQSRAPDKSVYVARVCVRAHTRGWEQVRACSHTVSVDDKTR